jgi:hypothetical protein
LYYSVIPDLAKLMGRIRLLNSVVDMYNILEELAASILYSED